MELALGLVGAVDSLVTLDPRTGRAVNADEDAGVTKAVAAAGRGPAKGIRSGGRTFDANDSDDD